MHATSSYQSITDLTRTTANQEQEAAERKRKASEKKRDGLIEYVGSVFLSTFTLPAWYQFLHNPNHIYSQNNYDNLLSGYQQGYDQFVPPGGSYSVVSVSSPNLTTFIQNLGRNQQALSVVFSTLLGGMAGSPMLWSGYQILHAAINKLQVSGDQCLIFAMTAGINLFVPLTCLAISANHGDYPSYDLGTRFGNADHNNFNCSAILPASQCPPVNQYHNAILNSPNNLTSYTSTDANREFGIIYGAMLGSTLLIRFGIHHAIKFCKNRYRALGSEEQHPLIAANTDLHAIATTNPVTPLAVAARDAEESPQAGCLQRVLSRMGWRR